MKKNKFIPKILMGLDGMFIVYSCSKFVNSASIDLVDTDENTYKTVTIGCQV